MTFVFYVKEMLFVFSFLAVFIKQRSNKAVHQPRSIPYSVQIDQKDSNKILMYSPVKNPGLSVKPRPLFLGQYST